MARASASTNIELSLNKFKLISLVLACSLPEACSSSPLFFPVLVSPAMVSHTYFLFFSPGFLSCLFPLPIDTHRPRAPMEHVASGSQAEVSG